MLNTTDCSPYESFAREDIELWAVLNSNETEPDPLEHGSGVDIRQVLCLVLLSGRVAAEATLLDFVFFYQRVDGDRQHQGPTFAQTFHEGPCLQTPQRAAGSRAGGAGEGGASIHLLLGLFCFVMRYEI